MASVKNLANVLSSDRVGVIGHYTHRHPAQVSNAATLPKKRLSPPPKKKVNCETLSKGYSSWTEITLLNHTTRVKVIAIMS